MAYQNLSYIVHGILLVLGLLLFPDIAKGESKQAITSSTNNSATEINNINQFAVFPVGINLDGRTINTSALVKGSEDGLKAINFEQWLIPFDIVIEALNISVTPLDNGKLELRSPGLVIKIESKKLLTDSDLGLVFKVSQIRDILGVPTEFDLEEYAIDFNPPWLNIESENTVKASPITTAGLTKINPASFSFTTIGERFRLNNNDLDSRDTKSQSDFNLIGTVFGGSWYAQINQSDILDVKSWQLGELQYLRQTDKIDYALGSQATFWQSLDYGQYWGLTTIQRFGFTPDSNFSSGGFNANLRRQPQVVNRSLAGIAQPGDVVHLVTKRRQEIIQEIIVDQTGTYQFSNVDSRKNKYQILIYPNGRLTASPEIREPVLTYVSGQLSQGTSTITTSVGIRRNLSDDSFLGKFKNLGGGFNYRRGITEQLTLGTGLVVDSSLSALGELFYQPTNIPLQLGISSLIKPNFDHADYTAYFNYQPTDKLNINFNSSDSSHNLHLGWRAFPGGYFRLGNNNRDEITTGLTFSHSGRLSPQGGNFSLLTSLDYGNNQGLKQRINARLNTWQFAHQGDREETFSRLSYSLSNDVYNSQGHEIFIGYDTGNSNHSHSVVNLGWHYRSGQNASDGGSLWDVELGYGFNSQGSSPIAALTTRAIPGTTVRFSYQGISPIDDDSRLRLDVFPNLRLQGRPNLGDRQMEKFRTQGGLLVRPFADKNTNGKLDRGEKIHTEDAELLLIINHKSLYSISKEINQRGVFIPLTPGKYRLDLDPAGYPFNLQPKESSYAVQVTAGSYTKLDLPLNLSYTAIGVVSDLQGKPVAGARVQAISSQSSQPILSVTNSAGVYFLEGLAQGTYNLTVNDRSVEVKPLEITPDSEPLQEINLKISN